MNTSVLNNTRININMSSSISTIIRNKMSIVITVRNSVRIRTRIKILKCTCRMISESGIRIRITMKNCTGFSTRTSTKSMYDALQVVPPIIAIRSVIGMVGIFVIR